MQTQQNAPATDKTFWLLFTNASWQQLVLGASAANVPGLTKPNASDIEVDEIVASSTGLYSVYLEDSSGKPLMPFEQIPIYGELVAGVAQLPFRLPSPMFIPRGISLSALFTDRSAAPNTIQFCLIGRKVS